MRSRRFSLNWFLRFEERFRKVPFSCRISVDGNRPNQRNKAAYAFKFYRRGMDGAWKNWSKKSDSALMDAIFVLSIKLWGCKIRQVFQCSQVLSFAIFVNSRKRKNTAAWK